nr:hypothetical protein [Desulfobulbaceae bacterium]
LHVTVVDLDPLNRSILLDIKPNNDTPPESIRTQLAEGMLREKEHLIKAAIQTQIGFAWEISDLKGRGEFIISPEKVETFVFDGVALIEFYPPEFFLDMNTIGGKQNYRLLYT